MTTLVEFFDAYPPARIDEAGDRALLAAIRVYYYRLDRRVLTRAEYQAKRRCMRRIINRPRPAPARTKGVRRRENRAKAKAARSARKRTRARK